MWKYDIGRIALGGPARDKLLAHEALSVNTPPLALQASRDLNFYTQVVFN